VVHGRRWARSLGKATSEHRGVTTTALSSFAPVQAKAAACRSSRCGNDTSLLSVLSDQANHERKATRWPQTGRGSTGR
jgi:hypothetical protein